uniref:Mucin 5f n=1 Tax=Astyanax mexicanus TaxID=7994 RepID=A0A8B9JC10_ASTMX
MQQCGVTTTTPLPTTTTPLPTTPAPHNCDNHQPPLKNGESIPDGKCSNITCINGSIVHEHMHCAPAHLPVCVNNHPPVKVTDDSGCCSTYECQCVCSGFGDPHYITFDGTYYPFQGNCSYVLVKEIHPKYNFSVIIDNVYCDSEDGLSCPKSLTVHYKSFEIFMAQNISNGIVTNLIDINGKRVLLPFENSDFRITDNGIESLVVIPAISAQVTFTGMMFYISLPWQKFHGNTEGQCGTCDNNRTDDCRLPNGTILTSCEKMAPHWHVHKNDSYCPPSPTPEPPIQCPNYTICEILSSKVFEKCHKVVPYEPFMKGCNYDICHTNKTSFGCTSLQMYAEECSMAGVCIDWRPETRGKCEFRCESPRVYKRRLYHYNERLLTTVPSEFSALETMRWEGCYCPTGTTLLSPFIDACAGAIWTLNNGCEICTCVPETLNVFCEAPVCPTQKPVTCDKEGQVQITETVGCCKNTTCAMHVCFINLEHLSTVCNSSLCQSKKHSCPVGYTPEVVMGVCCPEYGCGEC